MKDLIRNELNEHIKNANSSYEVIDSIESASVICINALKQGGKILLFGNGGSAADAQHIAAELVGRYVLNRRALSAIALTTDSSVITSVANDFDYNYIFARQVEALANESDVVIGISTSGSSENVINGLKSAAKFKCKTIGFCGQNNKLLNEICDTTISIPSNNTARIQEMHIFVGHCICHLIDLEFS